MRQIQFLILSLIFPLQLAAESLLDRAESMVMTEPGAERDFQVSEALHHVIETELRQLHFNPTRSVKPRALSQAQNEIVDQAIELLLPNPRDHAQRKYAEKMKAKLRRTLPLPARSTGNAPERIGHLAEMFGHTVERLILASRATDQPLVEKRARELLKITAEAVLISGGDIWKTQGTYPLATKAAVFGTLLGAAAELTSHGVAEHGLATLVAFGSIGYIFKSESKANTPSNISESQRVEFLERGLMRDFRAKTSAEIKRVVQKANPELRDFHAMLDYLDEILPEAQLEKACRTFMTAPTST